MLNKLQHSVTVLKGCHSLILPFETSGKELFSGHTFFVCSRLRKTTYYVLSGISHFVR